MSDIKSLDAALYAAPLPGLSAQIVTSAGVVSSHCYGQADAIDGTPMQIDTIVQIASLTKAIVSAAAMQLVERGTLDLDMPVGKYLPALEKPEILAGFDENGAPITRLAREPVTVKHLLTHTAGTGYFFVQGALLQYYMHKGMPAAGSIDSITAPLLCEPGERWEYGVATDWVGLLIEAVTGKGLGDFLSDNLLIPLQMNTTAFRQELPENAAKVHGRKGDGSFELLPLNLGAGAFPSGGGGLSATIPDYARFLRMMLRGGELDGARVLKPETVTLMGQNQIGDLRAGKMTVSLPQFANEFDLFPDQHTGWGLGFLINPEPGPNGRSANSLSWAGILNSYYWIDPHKDLAAVMTTQLSPFGDKGALDCFAALERMAYTK